MKLLKTIRLQKRWNLKAKIANFFLFIILLTIISCQTSEEIISNKIIGNWVIYEFVVNKKNYVEDLNLNYFSFSQDKTFSTPEIFKYAAEDKEDMTHWIIELDDSKSIKLSMNCKNPMFNNSYNVKFFRNDKKRLLGIELRSKLTYIKAYKNLQNFDLQYDNWEN